MRKQYHRYHLVRPSPWPFFASLSAFTLTISAAAYMHRYEHSGWFLILGFLSVITVMVFWWRDVIREATFRGDHTKKVQRSLRIGFALFIFSEVMFFFGFFWAFFHSSLSPAIQIGGIWPPSGIIAPGPWGIALANTLVLISSGVSITYTHRYILIGNRKIVREGFMITLIYAAMFIFAQICEYIKLPFDISDGIFGSTFYMLTGFHGCHVIGGAIFIFVQFIRHLKGHILKDHHVGFECAVWYWHFVDVVWLFLYLSIYYWGNQ